MNRSRARSRRGFTLVEMMVVIGIIGIMAGLLISVSGRTYGVSPQQMSEQIASTINLARSRAVATRRIQQVQVHLEMNPPQIEIWQASARGMSLSNLTVGPLQSVLVVRVPNTVVLHAAVTGAQAAGASPAQSTTQFNLNFRPDGSSTTAATLYVTDIASNKKHRVLVYNATGSSYARQDW